MNLLSELKRRNVFRVAIAYLITAWLLIQLADILIPMLALPEWVARLVLLLLVILFVPTLIAAWALELTPEGLKLEKDVDRSGSITPTTGKKLNTITIGLLALAVVVLLVDKFYLGADSLPAADSVALADVQKSIAVLPFADLSQEQDQEWFADGLAEEILNALARTPDLLVASRTTTFSYKGTTKSLQEIASELGVAHILEGSVRRAGDRLRITAQLIRASDGFHLWSENYDRHAADIIDVQEDLAIKIASAMQTTMDPAALRDMLKVGTQSVDAYQAYLRGVTLEARSFSSDDLDLYQEAYAKYEQARAIDPGFAAAHEKAAAFWESQMRRVLRTSGLTGASNAEIERNFLERVDLAIATISNDIDRQKFEAWKALHQLRWRRALGLYKRYLANRPNDLEGWDRFRDTAAYLNDREARMLALEYFEQAGQTSRSAASSAISDAYRLGLADRGADYGLAALERWPTDANLMYQLHRTLMWAKRPKVAADLVEQFEELYDPNPMMRARQACMEGRWQEVAAIKADLRAQVGELDNSIWLIDLLQDDQQGAAEFLRNFASAEYPHVLSGWLIYHKFDPRPYPELMAILAREDAERPPPAESPYTCPPEATSTTG
jgi:TolB-like protein